MPPSQWWSYVWRFLAVLCVMIYGVLAVEATASSMRPKKDVDDPKSVQFFERSLLSLFGMKQRPNATAATKAIVPPIMRNFYTKKLEALQSQQEVTRSQKKLGLLDANTVRSYYSLDVASRLLDSSHVVLWFNTSSLDHDEVLRAAELRIKHLRHPDLPQVSSNESSSKPRRKFSKAEVPFLHRVTISQILDARDSAKRIPLDTKLIDARTEGVVVFDVSAAARRWQENPRTNFGIMVTIHPVKDYLPANTSAHLRLRRSADDTPSAEWEAEQPLLITYSDDGQKKYKTKRASYAQKLATRSCQRHELYVDFSVVGWSNWILAPAGYDAFFCKGECTIPLSEHMNTTNHAVVQAVVNERYPERVPKPCCAPTELAPLSLLYIDDDDRIVLKTYQDMIVEGCGCL